ncbi:MAG: hypothetical protein CO129_10390 [Ignavibacteriales bacterium CG_4_9_14_3_um_filter_34_10]|nr:MAG: hypothetical protein CO129_10390 [Ignavibacteriales bacterium CG_4_9_14_3_um_filter_34_10]
MKKLFREINKIYNCKFFQKRMNLNVFLLLPNNVFCRSYQCESKSNVNLIFNSFLILVLSLTFFDFANAQDKKQKEKISDAFVEMESGELVLRFFDAITGNSVADGNVEIQTMGEFTTDFEGRILFIPTEENAVLRIRFSHPKYITSQFDIEIMAGALFFNRFSVSPKMPLGSLRVVIDWSDKPSDLDAHFVKVNNYHISYRNKKVSEDGIAKLDRDDTDGFGPETITTKNIDKNSVYYFYVTDFTNLHNSNSVQLSKSKCNVKIYGRDNELLNVLKVPENIAGDYWHVFKIINDGIIIINEIKNIEMN